LSAFWTPLPPPGRQKLEIDKAAAIASSTIPAAIPIARLFASHEA
jgi:hypothetical protein